MCYYFSFCQDRNGDLYHLRPQIGGSGTFDCVKVHTKEVSNNPDSHSNIVHVFKDKISDNIDGCAKYEMVPGRQCVIDYRPNWLTGWHRQIACDYAESLDLTGLVKLVYAAASPHIPVGTKNMLRHTRLSIAKLRTIDAVTLYLAATTIASRLADMVFRRIFTPAHWNTVFEATNFTNYNASARALHRALKYMPWSMKKEIIVTGSLGGKRVKEAIHYRVTRSCTPQQLGGLKTTKDIQLFPQVLKWLGW